MGNSLCMDHGRCAATAGQIFAHVQDLPPLRFFRDTAGRPIRAATGDVLSPSNGRGGTSRGWSFPSAVIARCFFSIAAFSCWDGAGHFVCSFQYFLAAGGRAVAVDGCRRRSLRSESPATSILTRARTMDARRQQLDGRGGCVRMRMECGRAVTGQVIETLCVLA